LGPLAPVVDGKIAGASKIHRLAPRQSVMRPPDAGNRRLQKMQHRRRASICHARPEGRCEIGVLGS
jgi:hypothetical protein